MVAIEQLIRVSALVWHKEASLDAADLVIIPGGFSGIICAAVHLQADPPS